MRDQDQTPESRPTGPHTVPYNLTQQSDDSATTFSFRGVLREIRRHYYWPPTAIALLIIAGRTLEDMSHSSQVISGIAMTALVMLTPLWEPD